MFDLRLSGVRALAVAIAVVFSLFAAPGVLPAQTADTAFVPSQYPTLTQALAAVPYGTNIIIAPGTYSIETGEVFPITLRDGVRLSGAGRDTAIIDATGSDEPIFKLQNTALTQPLFIRSLQLRGGAGTGPSNGGALSLDAVTSQSIYLQDCYFVKNRARYGGAIYANNTSLEATDCEFEANIASEQGGAVHCEGTSATLAFFRSTFRDNEARGSLGNRATPSGSASGKPTPSVLLPTRGFGGAASIGDFSTAFFFGCQFHNNSAPGGGGIWATGTVSLQRDDSTLQPTVIRNSSSTVGAALYFDTGGGLIASHTDIYSNQAERAVIYANEVAFNLDTSRIAYNNTGEGAIVEVRYGTVHILNNVFTQNITRSVIERKGTIISSAVCNGDILFNTFADNDFTFANDGSLVEVRGAFPPPSPALYITNNIFSGSDCYGIAEREIEADAHVRNNLFHDLARFVYFDEDATPLSSAAEINTSSTISGPYINSGNIEGDPAFVNPATEDYRLNFFSAAVDTGLSVTLSTNFDGTDADGRSRIGNAAGTVMDLGAYEFRRPQLIPPVFIHSKREIPPEFSGGDILVLRFDQPMAVVAPVDWFDFTFPVPGDTIGVAPEAFVNPDNPTQVFVRMGGANAINVAGVFDPHVTVAGSPSGIDLSPSGRFKIVAAGSTIPTVALDPVDGLPNAADIARPLGAWTNVSIPGNSPSTHRLTTDLSPLTYYRDTDITFSPGAFYHDVTISMRAADYPRAFSSAIQFNVVSGSPVFASSSSRAYLRMLFDLDEVLNAGYRPQDLRIHRLVEVAPDVYQFKPVSELDGDDIQWSLDIPTRSVYSQLATLIPPRPVFRATAANAEPPTTPTSCVYAVLPITIASHTIRTTDTLVSQLVPATLAPSAPDSLALSGVVLQNHALTNSLPAADVTVQHVDFRTRRPGGSTNRPYHHSPSGWLAFEYRDAATQLPYNIVQTPNNISLVLQRGLSNTYFADLWSADGRPCWPGQMRVAMWCPPDPSWEILPDPTIWDPDSGTVTHPDTEFLLEGGGVGLFSTVGVPWTPVTETFASGPRGWTSGNAAPSLDAPRPSISDGALKFRCTSDACYGWWGAPPLSYIASRDRIYILKYTVSTDVASGKVPGLQARVTSADFQRTSTISVGYRGSQLAIPDGSMPRTYTVFYEPSRRTVEAAHAGRFPDASFNPYFEMLNFGPDGQVGASIGLQEFTALEFDKEGVQAGWNWNTLATYDFVSTNTLLGWEFFSTTDWAPTFNVSRGARGAVIQGSVPNTFGGFNTVVPHDIQPGTLYRVRFRVYAENTNARVPTFRLRVGDTNFEAASCVAIQSSSDGAESPAYNTRDYDCYFAPPQPMATSAWGTPPQLLVSFDVINFSADDDPTTKLWIEKVTVDATTDYWDLQ